MAAPFRRNIQHVRHGEQGRAAVVRRPDAQLEQNILNLKDRVDALAAGEALFLYDVTVAPECLKGQPVYWNNTTERFEQALAAVTSDPITSVLIPADSTFCRGVVFYKTNPTLATLLVLGTATLDISDAVAGTVENGQYYLSSSSPGMLVKQRPAATVAVLERFSDGRVLVVPDVKDFLEDHIHFQYRLTALPAGDTAPPQPNELHVITNANSDLPGWLPADDPIFEGLAPAGAVFGYNLSQHPELRKVWPPIPVTTAVMEIFRPSAADIAMGADIITGGRAPSGIVTMDANGIWWMTACYNQAPWPYDIIQTGSLTSDTISQVSLCPTSPDMELILSFIRMTFATDKSVVTRITSDNDMLSVLGCDDNVAATGDLRLRVNLSNAVEDTGVEGSLVVKAIDEVSGKHLQGRVIEGLIAGTNIALTSDRQIERDGITIYQNVVTVSADTDAVGKELPIELVRLEDVRERYLDSLMYLAFPEGQISAFVGKLKVPPAAMPAVPSMKLRFVFLGIAAGDMPEITLTVTIVPRPTTPTTLPNTETTVVLDVLGVGTVEAGDYFEVESAAFAVDAGDTVFFKVSRADDDYAGELGVLRMGGIISAGS